MHFQLLILLYNAMNIRERNISNSGAQLRTKMNIHKIFSFSLLLFLSLFSSLLSRAKQTCSNSACGGNGPLIHFPFRLKNYQPKSCGYPSFDLSCDSTNQTTLELPNSGKFIVQAIDYATQELWINDPGNCLPLRILSLNLTGSPFGGVNYKYFDFFNCTSFDYKKYNRIKPLGCLSGINFTVFATSSPKAFLYLDSQKACSYVSTSAVPSSQTSSDLSDDLWLYWAAPRCRECESKGGQCGLKPNSTAEIVCHSARHGGKGSNAAVAVIVVAFVLAILFGLGLVCFLTRRAMAHHQIANPITLLTARVPSQPMIHPGLDRPTLDSYPRTILGESCRLPNPVDTICPICLSEYRPRETLRSIPECQHCFHADCIDEWLQVNGTCPVCRTSPHV